MDFAAGVLSARGSSPHTPPPYTLHTCIIQYTYSRRVGGKGGVGKLTREKIRGAIVHKAGRKYQHDSLYLQSIISNKHQPQSSFKGQFFIKFFCVFIDY
jgi:hypothetical protein